MKSLALTVPLLFALSCADECKGPDDCLPGQICQRPVEANGERGAAVCVAGANDRYRCATDNDCGGDAGRFICLAQRCVLRSGPGTTTGTPTVDGSTLDAANRDANPLIDVGGDIQDTGTSSTSDGSIIDLDGSLGDVGSSTRADSGLGLDDAGSSTVADGG